MIRTSVFYIDKTYFPRPGHIFLWLVIVFHHVPVNSVILLKIWQVKF